MTIEELNATQAKAKLRQLVELLQNTVNSGASIGFWSPLSNEVATDYWLKTIDEIAKGNRILLVVVQEEQVVGSVQLELATKSNAKHRAEVQKLMVHTRWRRQGLAQQLLAQVDTITLRLGRNLLVLDTKQGDAAERLYQKYGYIEAGSIPHYTQDVDGVFAATVLFYRELQFPLEKL